MFGQIRTRRPPKSFSLLYLESNEVHLLSLKVSFVAESSCEEIEGKLHLCSRSIFFEPKNIAKPLLRFKFSSGLFLRMLKNIETKKLQRLVSVRRTQAEFKSLMAKGPAFITQLLEQEQGKKGRGRSPALLGKLFEPVKRKKESEDKITSAIFIRVPKLFFIYRKPISPYITEKTEDNFVFVLNKSNPTQQILRFLKLYDELAKFLDEDKLIRSIIAATQEESAEEILEAYQDEKLEAANILKARRVTIEGAQHGHLVLLKNKIKFYPLINAPDYEELEITYREIKFLTRYRYLFQNIGVEMWLFNSPYSLLFTFQDHTARETVFRQLREKAEKLVKLQLESVTSSWVSGQISNIHYLNVLNVLAGRSLNDLSQYPIFPWVLHSYDGDFDLKNGDFFRDLSKPIGAINKHRLKKQKDFYDLQVKDRTLTTPAHLYPTHYSTPGYVSYYLIRKIPEFIVRIQNGVFSPSDRIFRSVESAYYSTMNHSADFKELIPEFYATDCDFLVNSEKLEMGSTPQGELIDDVVLPKWATSCQDFLSKMRAAFESDYVSAHLNEWVDLVFGFKQLGTPAITYDNLFYHLTYQENVNFDRPMSRVERAALEVQVAEFGQTPLQLFEDRHPGRRVRLLSLEVGGGVEDKKVLNAKLVALAEQNQRLSQELERQKNRFSRKLYEKEEMLMRNNKDKKRELEKMKEMLNIDTDSLRKFAYRTHFESNEDKDVYVRQIEQLLKRREHENAQMDVIIAGLKRQLTHHPESVNSSIEPNAKLEDDFFEDEHMSEA